MLQNEIPGIPITFHNGTLFGTKKKKLEIIMLQTYIQNKQINNQFNLLISLV